ncbi:MAG: phosphopantetheine-protein transferase [Chloroflexi bacterium]|nr:MAG: phosphopantetheine-protein transferase [Chloroflexota bacterium]MBL1193780.1 4'-phosphopantetheinyl transferase superfamily protein [Chloroflexota bacterium]NOH11073.1 4'-phosphopantetheinyl transferase superfamily protein [Chloroflexota bacterium]
MNASHEWIPSQREAIPHKNEVHVWRISVPKFREIIPQLQPVLNEEERTRADRFHFDKDQESYIIAHSVLRLLLGGYAQLPSEEIEFTVNNYGKPQIVDNSLQFNLSHSGDFVLIAIANSLILGVDVEKIHTRRAKIVLAKRFFSPLEFDHLMQLASGDFVQGFFNTWTRKEAYIKAIGAGLSIPLDSFTVSLKTDSPVELIEDSVNTNAPGEWTLKHIKVNDDYAAALAVKCKEVELKLFDWLGPINLD